MVAEVYNAQIIRLLIQQKILLIWPWIFNLKKVNTQKIYLFCIIYNNYLCIYIYIYIFNHSEISKNSYIQNKILVQNIKLPKRKDWVSNYHLLRRAAEAITQATPTAKPNANGIHTPKLSIVAGTICCIKLLNSSIFPVMQTLRVNISFNYKQQTLKQQLRTRKEKGLYIYHMIKSVLP